MRFLYLCFLAFFIYSCSPDPVEPTPTPPPNSPTTPTTPTTPVDADTIPPVVNYAIKGYVTYGRVEQSIDKTLFMNFLNTDFSNRWSLILPGNIFTGYFYAGNAIYTLTLNFINNNNGTSNTTSFISKIDPADGHLIWQKSFIGFSAITFTIDGNTIYMDGRQQSFAGGFVKMIDAGTGVTTSTMGIAGDYALAYLTPEGSKLYSVKSNFSLSIRIVGYDLFLGEELWSVAPPVNMLNVPLQVVPYGDNLLIGGANKIASIKKSDGSTNWITPVQSTEHVFLNNRIYSFSGKSLFSFDAGTGVQNMQWSNDTTMYRISSFDQENVFMVLTQNYPSEYIFVAVNALTGKTYYRRKIPFGIRDINASGIYSYGFKAVGELVGNQPAKMIRFDNRTGRIVDSAMVPFGSFAVIK